MAEQTNRNLRLDNISVGVAGQSVTLNSKLQTLVLQARGADMQVKLGAVGDTEYWTLKDGQPQSFSIPDLAGATIYLDCSSGTQTVEVLQILRES